MLSGKAFVPRDFEVLDGFFPILLLSRVTSELHNDVLEMAQVGYQILRQRRHIAHGNTIANRDERTEHSQVRNDFRRIETSKPKR